MYNYLLDRLPTEYEGYLIRTDYRIGMQIDMCLSDRSFPEEDRVLNALYLLYGNGIPDDFIVAYKGLVWFMSCGEKELTDYENQIDAALQDSFGVSPEQAKQWYNIGDWNQYSIEIYKKVRELGLLES